MDSVTTGLSILDGRTTRVVTSSGLVFLEDIGGDTDLSGYYTKQEVDQRRASIDTQLLFKQHVISSTPGTAMEVWDSTNNLVRRLVAGTNISFTLDANGNIVVNSTGSGIPSTVATFDATGINLIAVTTASTLNAFMITSGTVRCSTYEGIGSDVSLSGTGSAIVSCTDTNGTCSVASKCRTGQEGVHVTTNTTNAMMCLQNTTASRHIHLSGSVMFFGQLANPGLVLSDTAISLKKATYCTGTFSSSAAATHGVHTGVETSGFARCLLVCDGTTARSFLDFSYAGNQSSVIARIEGVPEKTAGVGDSELKFHTNGVVRMTITNSSVDYTLPVTSPSLMPRSELATTFQPLLSSTFDDPANGFHSILASAPHGNDKTKYIAAGSGLDILSSYEHIAFSLSPFANMLATYGFDELSASSGWTSYPVDT